MGHLGDADRRNTQGSGPFPRASHATAVPMTACPAQHVERIDCGGGVALGKIGERSRGKRMGHEEDLAVPNQKKDGVALAPFLRAGRITEKKGHASDVAGGVAVTHGPCASVGDEKPR